MKNAQTYRCTICGYLYQESQGEPSSGVPEETAWDQVPEEWTCPMCGVSKNDFELLD